MVDNDSDDALRLQIRKATADAARLYIGTWRQRAEELRAIADGMKSDHGRRGMLNAAANYDRLADDAERRGRPEASRSQPETEC
jgi:hypothetical protein